MRIIVVWFIASMHPHRIACVALLVCVFLIPPVNAETYTIVAGTIDKAVEIAVPTGFRLAASREELERRERLLNFYCLNKKIRGTYSEIFRSAWGTTYPYPTIVVSTLGTTKKLQGKITESDWKELRQFFRDTSTKQLADYKERFQPGIRSSMPVDYEVISEMSWVAEEYDDRVIIMAITEWRSDETRYVELSARVVIYFSGYLIVLDFKEDASKSDAANRLRDWISQTRIMSVVGH